MPPSPPSNTTAALLLLLTTLFLPFLTAPATPHTCLLPPETLCPPFTSPPPYPFSFSAGCGHPSFQLHCPSPALSAAISVNNLTFSLLRYDSNSTSITLSPTPTPPSHRRRGCSPTAATLADLNGSISFSGSPFRVSDSSCARLSALKPCPPPNLPNCSRCPLECKLIQNPIHLIPDCGEASTRHRDDFHQQCRDDVLDYLDIIVLNKGIEVEWDQDQDPYFSSCRACQARNGTCGFNSSEPDKPFLCLPVQARIRQKSPNRIAILIITSLFLVLLIALSIVFVVLHSRKRSLPDAAGEDPTAVFLRYHRSASLLPPLFAYDDLDSSTNHFDPKRKIGDGGFGSVYLGQLPDGSLVAVKHLHKHNSKNGISTKSFCNEILILSSIHHPNLVRLHGYCSDPRGLLLVYDYVPNGTLADHLHGEKKKSPYRNGALSWPTRVDIACQTAMAVEYLHFSVVPPVIHRDITSSNIFVDRDMRVKLGDFGLSRLLVGPEATAAAQSPSEGVWTGPQGTPGYLDPDYYASFRLNEKSDIYSFGVVLLELMTGMRAVGPAQGMSGGVVTLVEMVVPRIQMGLLHEVMDPTLAVGGEGVGAVAELAFRCLAADKDDRPDAREVAAELRRIRAEV
ncbi:Protein kinase superfamily protein [Striga hermonthica]|uniref:Protein kinase superfamily protein n=1 Tax=Striga hermonthica TaxID=68872 RepID=A0A9N7NPQ7_STRHE|nr:Protein kinase superfamily protein [Striga hermonthica]